MNPSNFLGNGLLPKEMPPCFSTSSLAKLFAGRATLPFEHKQAVTRPATFSLARAGGSRRSLKIANPCSYYRLAEAICTEWLKLKSLINRSTISISKPIEDLSGERAVVPSIPLSRLLFERQKNRANGRFAMIADIGEFYPTLYSHALAWAIDGKAAAKQGMGKSGSLGDRIDSLTRALSDNETTGIPIGPDLSLVLAELVLSAVDEEVVKTCKPKSAIRYFDDYELIFDTKDDAARSLSALERILGNYNLKPNSLKTRVVELPSEVEKPWIRELRSFELPIYRANLRIHDYFELAICHQKQHPDQLVMSYAVSRLDAIVSTGCWSTLEPILIQVLRTIPGTTPIVINTVAHAQAKKCTVDKDSLEDCLNVVIGNSASLNHSSEACWAMWAIGAFSLKVADETLTHLERSTDPTLILLTLYLRELGRLRRSPETSRWEQLLATDFTKGEYWMLGYEAYRRNWLTRKSSFIEGNRFFDLMEKSNCSFLKPIMIEKERAASVSRRLRPYDEVDDSDYDSDEEDEEDEEDEDKSDWEF